MGTPDFAVESLRRLVEGGYNVVGVVTMPDKPVGRHHTELQPSPVKSYALEKGIPVLQPEKLKDPQFLQQLESLKADLQVVVAFRMLPEVVWNMPPKGTFNLHAALLPQYRGAAPINWAVINGDTESGVTTFFLDKDIDTGSIIYREKVEILPTDNAGDLHDKLMVLGAELVVKTVADIQADRVHPLPQSQFYTDPSQLRPAPKIFKDTCRIDWSRNAVKPVYDFIRGLSPYPAAWTELDNGGDVVNLKVYAAEMKLGEPSEPSGTVLADDSGRLCVALSDGYVCITSLQMAGKKRMSSADFLRGFHLDGDCRVI